jgi:phosphoenolpyruvate carboxykinase (ATP)
MATISTDKELSRHGITAGGETHWNLSPAELVEEAVRRGEGMLTADGSFVGVTTPHTGRSPNDQFVTRDGASESEIWWGNNAPLDPESYDRLRADVVEHLSDGKDLFVRDVWCGADPQYRLAARVISPNAWHCLFVHNMFREPSAAELAQIAQEVVS